jgi:hypothetical protein
MPELTPPNGKSGDYVITITGPLGHTWTWRGYASSYSDALALADLKRDEWVSD